MDIDNDDTFKRALSNLEENVNEKARQGAYLLIIIVLYLALMLLISSSLNEMSLPIATGIFFILALGSFGYSFHWGRNGRRFIYSLKILNLLSPPHPSIVTRSAIIERPPVFIVAKWGHSWLYFIRILNPQIEQTGRIQLPRFLTRINAKHEIDGLSIARIEGIFSLHSGDGMYVSGEGILYALPLERDFWRPRKNPLSRGLLMNVVRQLTLDRAKEKQAL